VARIPDHRKKVTHSNDRTDQCRSTHQILSEVCVSIGHVSPNSSYLSPHCVKCFTQCQQTEPNSHTPPCRMFSTKQNRLSKILHNTPWKCNPIERVDNLAYEFESNIEFVFVILAASTTLVSRLSGENTKYCEVSKIVMHLSPKRRTPTPDTE